MSELEQKLLDDYRAGKAVSLERGLLILAGLETVKEIASYTQKLEQIHSGFLRALKRSNPAIFSIARKYSLVERARLLFGYLWNTKPKRSDGNYLLAEVIDAQLNPDLDCPVGSCVGLTSLYTVLGLREGLKLSLLVNGDHILNRLQAGEAIYNIENTDPLGFDCDLGEKPFAVYPVWCLLAHVFNSRGVSREKAGDLEAAMADFDKAIAVNPEYANPYNNRANIRFKRKDYRGALEDYDLAVRLHPEFIEAYCNRGLAKERLGDYRGAIEDFDRAIAIDPHYQDAQNCRAKLKKRLS